MKNRARRIVLFGAVVASLLVAAVTAAVSQGRTNAQATPAAQEVSGSIRLAGWTSGGSTEGVLLKQVLAGFAKKYPKIKVTYTALDPYQQNMLAQFAARKPPDVFYVDSNDFPDWAKQGAARAAWPVHREVQVQHQAVFPAAAERVPVQGQALRVPEGLLAVVDAGQHRDAPASRRECADDVGAAAVGRSADEGTEHPGRRTPDLPAARVGSHARVHLPERWFDAERDQDAGDGEHPRGSRDAVNFYVGLINDGLAGTQQQLGAGWCGEALGKEKAAIIFEGNWVMPFMAEQFPSVNYRVNRMIRNKQAAT